MDLRVLFGVNLLVGTATGLSGFTFNSWIVHVNAKDWRRAVHLSLPDQILTFMGVINITLQAVLCFDLFSIQTNLYSSFDQIHLSCIGLVMFLVFSNIWLTTWLSIYYCMKIVNFTGRILLVCKMRISRFLPKLLVVSTVGSFIWVLPSFWNIRPAINEGTIGNSTHNLTNEQGSILVTFPYMIAAFLGCILPLVLTFIPIGLTLTSLWRHMKRMNKNKPDSHQPRAEAHLRAARTMVHLVSLHTGVFATSIYQISKRFNFYDVLIYLCWYFTLLYPTTQALVIIIGNSKLRKASQGVLSPRCHVVFGTGTNIH